MKNKKNSNKDNSNQKRNKKISMIQIVLVILSIAFVFLYFNNNKNIFANKETDNNSDVIAQYEEKIQNLNSQLDKEKDKNTRDIAFKNLFNNKLSGKYTINGKTGNISMFFEDNFYGKLSFAVKYNTEDNTLIKQINEGKIKITSPSISFKIAEMDETKQFIELSCQDFKPPTASNEDNSIVENISFSMLDDSEIMEFNLRGWFINNKFVGDLVNSDNNVIGTFEMNISTNQETKIDENQVEEEIENPK